MAHWEYWPRKLPRDQKCIMCPKCGALTTHEIRQHETPPDACRLICSEDAGHWQSDWGELTWEGREVSSEPATFRDNNNG